MSMMLSARQSPIRARKSFVNDVRAAIEKLTTPFNSRGLTKMGCGLPLLIMAMAAIAQSAGAAALLTTATDTPATATVAPSQTTSAPPTSAKAPATLPKISYVDGQLRISVQDSTLADVLTQVAALTGVKLDVPAGASSERMPVVELGPGPARQVLAALLSESTFDYVIQSSATDPEKMQSVLLMVRETKDGKTNGVDLAAARPPRSPYSRAAAAAAQSVATPASEASITAQPESAAPDPNSSNPQPPPTPPDMPTPLSSTQPSQSNFTRPGALTPPASLSPESMSQQLQQMYQQRMQMVQQNRQIGQQSTPSNPGNN